LHIYGHKGKERERIKRRNEKAEEKKNFKEEKSHSANNTFSMQITYLLKDLFKS
jgi:hypothetical protein